MWHTGQKRAKMREEKREEDGTAVCFCLCPCQLGPELTLLLQMMLSPTESENPSIRGCHSSHVQLLCYTEILLIEEETAACPVCICKTLLLSAQSGTRSILQRSVNRVRVQFHKWLLAKKVDPHPLLFTAR